MESVFVMHLCGEVLIVSSTLLQISILQIITYRALSWFISFLRYKYEIVSIICCAGSSKRCPSNDFITWIDWRKSRFLCRVRCHCCQVHFGFTPSSLKPHTEQSPIYLVLLFCLIADRVRRKGFYTWALTLTVFSSAVAVWTQSTTLSALEHWGRLSHFMNQQINVNVSGIALCSCRNVTKWMHAVLYKTIKMTWLHSFKLLISSEYNQTIKLLKHSLDSQIHVC